MFDDSQIYAQDKTVISDAIIELLQYLSDIRHLKLNVCLQNVELVTQVAPVPVDATLS